LKIFATIALLIILFTHLNLAGQFMGGGNDGFSRSSPLLMTVNDQASYCQGNTGDGFDAEYSSTGVNSIQFYCLGGFGDGFNAEYRSTGVNNLQYYCIGGYGDGTDQKENISSVNGQDIYCTGGMMDGNSTSVFNGYTYGFPFHTLGGTADGFCRSAYHGEVFPPSYALGGFADGHCFSVYFGLLDYPVYVRGGRGDGSERGADLAMMGQGIWTGKKNTDWQNTGNWKHAILPGQQTNVLIPSACIYYPHLTKSLSINSSAGILRCNRLDILNGGQITGTSVITINGVFNVRGALSTINTDPEAIRVESGGELKIIEPGWVVLEQ